MCSGALQGSGCWKYSGCVNGPVIPKAESTTQGPTSVDVGLQQTSHTRRPEPQLSVPSRSGGRESTVKGPADVGSGESPCPGPQTPPVTVLMWQRASSGVSLRSTDPFTGPPRGLTLTTHRVRVSDWYHLRKGTKHSPHSVWETPVTELCRRANTLVGQVGVTVARSPPDSRVTSALPDL